MESNEQNKQQEKVLVTLELPRDVVDWIDGLKAQMGFRSRGLIVAQLLRELIPALVEEDDQSGAGRAA
jgi:metal-responsive CopG/Arc/MetJ family transcriptional regulator